MHILDQQSLASKPISMDDKGTEAMIDSVLADQFDPSDFRLSCQICQGDKQLGTIPYGPI